MKRCSVCNVCVIPKNDKHHYTPDIKPYLCKPCAYKICPCGAINESMKESDVGPMKCKSCDFVRVKAVDGIYFMWDKT